MLMTPVYNVRLNSLADFNQNSCRQEREELLVKLVWAPQMKADVAVRKAENFMKKVFFDCPYNDHFIGILEALGCLIADKEDPLRIIEQYTNDPDCSPASPIRLQSVFFEWFEQTVLMRLHICQYWKIFLV